MNSAVAIVLYFILPTAWTILGNLIAALHRAAEWLDPGSTLAPLQSGAAMSGQSWAKVGTSVAVWVGLPMLVGVVRLLRREVK